MTGDLTATVRDLLRSDPRVAIVVGEILGPPGGRASWDPAGISEPILLFEGSAGSPPFSRGPSTRRVDSTGV